MDKTNLRRALTAVDEAIAKLPGGADHAPLRATFDGLVAALALGPAPTLRTCTSCGHVVMLEATRCGHCWVLLKPPADEPAA